MMGFEEHLLPACFWSIGQLANTLAKVGVPLLRVREYLLQYIVGSEREV